MTDLEDEPVTLTRWLLVVGAAALAGVLLTVAVVSWILYA